ncbi:MAG: 2-dehydropantoate 2-reductase [Anaerolineales bacterium]
MNERILIFGAGAIGTYLGASLANQGNQVIFLERKQDLNTLQEQGLRLEVDGRRISANASFISDLEDIRSLNLTLGILALKTYQLETILPDLIQFKRILPPLLCLQNGVESEMVLAGALGEDCVIPGTVTSAVDRLKKGSVVVRKLRGMGIAGQHERVKSLVTIFNQAGLNCRYYQQAAAMKWSKLLTNLLGNASSAILDLTPAEIYSDQELYKIELEQVREALRVMNELGIQPLNLPGVPVQLLAGLSKQVGGGRGQKMPSFHIDLYSGRKKSEVDQLNGAVVRAGERIGCSTPVNRFLTRTLMGLITGEIPLDRYSKDRSRFLKDLQASRVSE